MFEKRCPDPQTRCSLWNWPPVVGGFSASGKIVFLQQRIQELVDMYRRVIAICMGRSIERQDGKDFERRVSCHFQIGAAPDTLTDRQRNWIYRVFQKFLKDNDVHFFTTYNEETKASIVERFNRTLKTKMWKYFTHRETVTYVEVLSEMVASYNHTVHITIGIPPAEVTWANQTVSKRLYGRKGPKQSCKFSPGVRVRLSKAKRTFKKGYLPNWTEELFTVVKCIEIWFRYISPGILSQRRPR